MDHEKSGKLTCADISATENEVIAAGRAETGKQPEDLIGLAFSGGGIRSATFNLGVLQGLAEAKLLKRFDYLSTVSGGGYIGSWFSALLHRKASAKASHPYAGDIADALEELQNELSPKPQAAQATQHSDSVPNGHYAIQWLRRYSAYLTPRYGLFSLDTLAAVAGLFRNLLLNQTILICMLMVMLLLPYGLIQSFLPIQAAGFHKEWIGMLLIITAVLILLAVWNIRLGLTKNYKHSKIKVALVVLIAFVATGSAAMLFYTARLVENADLEWMVTGAVCLGYIAGFILDWRKLHWALLTGAALAAMLFGYVKLLEHIPAVFLGTFSLVLGPAILIQILCMAAIVHTGLVGRGFNEMNREWLGRAGGLVFALEMIWVAFTSLALFAPALVDYLDDWMAYGGGIAWAISSIATFWLARSNKTGGSKSSNPLLEKALSVAPYLVMLGLLVILSNGLHNALYRYSVDGSHRQKSPPIAQHHDFTITITNDKFDKFEASPPGIKPTLYRSIQNVLQEDSQIQPCVLIVTFVGLFALGVLLARRVDVNLFSMHQFYRNRLARAYLGASNKKRDPNPFTDFSDNDDLPLSAFDRQRPVHLINTTLNLTRIDNNELAWQERRGMAFMFSPHCCGYQFSPQHQHYVPTKSYMKGSACEDGVMLGTAIAVSGAAASPNMGYHSSPPLAFLMTFFNVRLGRWCPNTSRPNIQLASPKFGLQYLLMELFGLANDKSKFVNLTDGGHFENLGIYELVRRRCKLIIASDAGADDMDGFTYEDLGNAIQKCRVDFGATIEMLGMHKLKPRQAQSRVAWGRIRYADGSDGMLIYLKPLLRGNETVDAFHYAATHLDFPHQSTGDQWFEESQFESYRQLGLLTIREMLNKLGIKLDEIDNGTAKEQSNISHREFIATVQELIDQKFPDDGSERFDLQYQQQK